MNHGDMEGTGPMEREASICHTPKPLPGIFLSFVPPVFSSHRDIPFLVFWCWQGL